MAIKVDEIPRVEFFKTLGVRDVALMVVIAVVSLRWIPRAARAGWPSVSLWCLAGLCFFLPLAAVVVELSARYPEQGGLYVWVREAFGSRHAFFCGWCLWLNEVFYFPSYLLFALANLLALGGQSTAALAKDRVFSATVVLALLWGLTAFNILGLRVTKWFQNLGTLGIWLPVGLLFGAVALVVARTGAATTPHLTGILPRFGSLGALGLWSSMCFAFSGMEIAGMVGQEIRNPRRTVPIGLGLGGLAIVLLYLGGSAAILVVIPADRIAERTGISDAIQLAMHSPRIANVVSALISIAAVVTTSSWMAGSARLPYAAAAEGRLPRVLAKVHPRFRTPHIALIVQAAGASVTLLVSMFLNVENQSTTVEEAYDVLVNLTILIYFVPYLYMFMVPLRLKAMDSGQFPVIPFGVTGRVLVSALGSLTTLISIGLLFIPPPGTHSVWNFESNLILQSGLIFAAGLLMDHFRNRNIDNELERLRPH